MPGAASGQALDLGLEETQRCGFAIAFEACFEASDILSKLLDQGEVLGEGCQARVRGWAGNVDGRGNFGNQRGIDRVGLGTPFLEAAPAMHLTRIEDKHDEVVLAQVASDSSLIVAGGFETNPLHAKALQEFSEYSMAGSVIRHGEALGAAGNGDVERALGDVDTS